MSISELNQRRIVEIEKCFSGRLALFAPQRILIGEGVLIKMCRKKPKTRLFFLFNDLLVYCSAVVTKKLYRSAHVMPLETMQVDANVEDSGELRNGWKIFTPTKSFCVYASSDIDKDQWVAHLERCIAAQRPRTNAPNTLGAEMSPIWIPDDRAPTCMCCRAAFSFVNRRHHCRKCGNVVCNSCSSNRAMILTQSDRPVRVCNACFVKMPSPTPPNASAAANASGNGNSDSDPSRFSSESHLYDTVGNYVSTDADNCDRQTLRAAGATDPANESSDDDDDDDGEADNASNSGTLAGSEWYTYALPTVTTNLVVDLGAAGVEDPSQVQYSVVQKNKRVACLPTQRQTLPPSVASTGVYAIAGARPAEH